MKKHLTILLVLCLSVGLCACTGTRTQTSANNGITPSKSVEAQKVDELILAIGDVTVDSEDEILAAQEHYDTLTEDQKAEVEYYDILTNAQELLTEKKIETSRSQAVTLIEQGDYLQASNVLFENPKIGDREDLMKQCGQNVLQQYIKENGTEKEPEKYFLNLTNSDGTQISVWYFAETNAIQFLYYSSSSVTTEAVVLNYSCGGSDMTFTRSTINAGMPVNYQEGTININEYTGKHTGSLIDNSTEPLVITGLSVTKAQTVYEKQTKGYQVATKNIINEMLNALFDSVQEGGFQGTISDIGFVAYQSKQGD